MANATIHLDTAISRASRLLHRGRLDDEPPGNYLSRQIRQLCVGYGITQSELARQIGDHPSELSRLVCGGVPGRSMVKTLDRLRAAGVDLPADLPALNH